MGCHKFHTSTRYLMGIAHAGGICAKSLKEDEKGPNLKYMF